MTRIPSVHELAQHARDLAKKYNITLMEFDVMPVDEAISLAGVRWGKESKVAIKTITDTVTYCIALHEIGHCVHPTGSIREGHTSRNIQLILIEEKSAWEWAQHHALDWTVEMESVKIHSMESYYIIARRQAHAKIVRRDSLDDFLGRRK